MKIEVKVPRVLVTLAEMEVGDLGVVVHPTLGSSNQGDILLRAYETLICLNRPSMTWEIRDMEDSCGNPSYVFSEGTVELLPPGTVLTLTLEGPK